VKRIEKNILDINEKNQQLNKLSTERDNLKRDVSQEDSATKDANISNKKAQLDKLNKDIETALTEKNQIYDDLAKNTKDLIAKDEAIQKNSQEIAKLTIELANQKKELL
jgi:chromosome segregation ATPase